MRLPLHPQCLIGNLLALLAFAMLGLPARASPQLVTPQLPRGEVNEPYAATLMVGSTVPLRAATLSGLPAGLAMSHNGRGSIAIAGQPSAPGDYAVTVSAVDDDGATLSTIVALRVIANDFAGAEFVTAGGTHSCAVVFGGVQCWGENGTDGKLGNNSLVSSLVPVQVFPAGSGATRISAGKFHSCAVLDAGLWCWGLVQLAAGITSARAPVQILPPGSGVTSVSVGNSHTCFVASGGVSCWGTNEAGQLGDGSTITRAVPIQTIPPNSGVTDVSTGPGHTCMVQNGGVKCWGGNSQGELANPASVASSTVPIQAIAANSGATSVSSGNQFTCATIAGGVQCWGSNSTGQLGNGALGKSHVPVVALPVGSGATAVSTGNLHACAVVNGGARCWGWNENGTLGNGTAEKSLIPVTTVADGSGVTAISAGFDHSCAVKSGAIKCWGSNALGRLGTGRETRSLVPTQAIEAGGQVLTAAAGQAHTCAVVDQGAKCWGRNFNGQLGNGTTTRATTPVTAIDPSSSVFDVAAGSSQSCALVADGLACWGAGKLGNNIVFSSVPLTILPGGSLVSGVSVGVLHTCVVANGGVSCWGVNGSGQLGNDAQTDSNTPVVALPPGSGATAVVVGGAHSCALVNDGVRCWGSNSFGQLGINSTMQSLVPVDALPPGSNVIAIAAGQSHTCAATAGQVSCWGANTLGQLGQGDTTQRLAPAIVPAAGGNIAAVTAGLAHTCVISSGGVRCWGLNGSGQLGDGTGVNSPSPVQAIPPGSNVTRLASGGTHSCATVSKGVVCWGANADGQLAEAHVPPAELLPLSTLILPAFVPAAPTGVTATGGFSLASIAFSAPAVNGGAAVIDYRATCLPGPASVVSTSSPITIGGLTNGTAYSCSVSARNVVGSGPDSAAVVVTPNATTSLRGVVSRKIHGTAGGHDLPIDRTQPANGQITVEPRMAGTGHLVVYQFDGPIALPGVATTTVGTASAAIAANNEVIVTLANIPDNRRTTIALNGVNGSVDIPPITIGFLLGDVDGSRINGLNDVSSIKVRSGRAVDATNFRYDLNLSGQVNAADIAVIKARQGLSVP